MNKNWSDEKCKQVLNGRRMGFYNCEDTREECLVAYQGLEESDRCFTLLHSQGLFTRYNEKELEDNIALWRRLKVNIQEYNIRQLDLADGTKVWCFVVQPPGKKLEDCNLCPLGMAHGLMVSGYCYFTKDKKVCDWVRNSVMRGRKAVRASK